MEGSEVAQIRGLKFARGLDFTDAQYEEALKRIDSPDNLNQLLVALIDVSSRPVDPATVNNDIADQSNVDFNQVVRTEQQVVRQPAANVTGGVFERVPGNSTSQTLATQLSSHLDHLLDQQHNGDSSSSLSTSCYSSITSFASASDQSLESLQHQHQPPPPHRSMLSVPSPLRKIYIDGSNVAREHGRNVTFSWLGVKLCVDWFLSRGHQVVKVFVPMDKCACPQTSPDSEAIIEQLSQLDVLIKTPLGCNDDLFIIEAARQNNGVIVSNDQFRHEKRFYEGLVNYINSNRLPYIFVDDLFLPAPDPLGRAAPRTKLDDFLRESSTFASGGEQANMRSSNNHHKLSRTKSHQRYQRNGLYSRQANNQPHQVGVNLHRSLQATMSLPAEQLRSSPASDNNQPQISTAAKSAQFRYTQARQTPSRLDNQDRQVKKSFSVACGNELQTTTTTTTTTTTKDTQPMFAGGQRRSALCRTKSHNI